MGNRIDDLCSFMSRYLGIEEESLFNKDKSTKDALWKHLSWYILHTKYKIPISQIARAFERTDSMVKKGISKMRVRVAYDIHIKELYPKLLQEYESQTKQTRG